MNNTFKVLRIASEICELNKNEIRLLAELLIDTKNAEELQFQINVAFQDKSVVKEIA
jgi:hypothetical protein